MRHNCSWCGRFTTRDLWTGVNRFGARVRGYFCDECAPQANSLWSSNVYKRGRHD